MAMQTTLVTGGTGFVACRLVRIKDCQRQAPNFVVRLIGPFFGLTQDYMRKHIGVRFKVDNRRSIEELGIQYRPLEQTLIDHYRSWTAHRNKELQHDT
jgi:nucleoside-diphosphate-sugar epimerase